MDEDQKRLCYVLRDCKSGMRKTIIIISIATWVRIRYDVPVVVRNNMEINIGKQIYTLKFSEYQVNEA